MKLGLFMTGAALIVAPVMLTACSQTPDRSSQRESPSATTGSSQSATSTIPSEATSTSAPHTPEVGAPTTVVSLGPDSITVVTQSISAAGVELHVDAPESTRFAVGQSATSAAACASKVVNPGVTARYEVRCPAPAQGTLKLFSTITHEDFDYTFERLLS